MSFLQRRPKQERRAKTDLAAIQTQFDQLFPSHSPSHHSSRASLAAVDPADLVGRNVAATEIQSAFYALGMVSYLAHSSDNKKFFRSPAVGIEVSVDAGGVIESVFL